MIQWICGVCGKYDTLPMQDDGQGVISTVFFPCPLHDLSINNRSNVMSPSDEIYKALYDETVAINLRRNGVCSGDYGYCERHGYH
jgi:hypothetical protein